MSKRFSIQIACNLILNALQYTPSGGEIEINIERNDGKLLLSVEDSGPDVPQDEREKIFEPFMTTRADGSGLGWPLYAKS